MSDTVAKILTSFEALRSELTRLGPGWSEHPESDFFCTLDWFENLAKNGLDEGAMSGRLALLFVVSPRSGLAACLPLVSGTKLVSLSNYYSSFFSAMLWERAGSETPLNQVSDFYQNATKLFATLIQTQLAGQAELQLSPMDSKTAFVAGLASALKTSGFWTDFFFCFGNWYLQVAQRRFDVYRTSLPSALQHSIDRGQRRLSKHGDWGFHVQTHVDANLDAAIADFNNVYRQSWKRPEPHDAFIPSLIRLAAQKQWLRMGILRLDGKPVAAQFWMVKNNKASIFKLAYVQGFERFSPGSVLTARLMRHVLDIDKVSEVDYLTGDDAYKKDWMSHRRERWGLLAFRGSSARGWVRAARHFLGKALRKVFRQTQVERIGPWESRQ